MRLWSYAQPPTRGHSFKTSACQTASSLHRDFRCVNPTTQDVVTKRHHNVLSCARSVVVDAFLQLWGAPSLNHCQLSSNLPSLFTSAASVCPSAHDQSMNSHLPLLLTSAASVCPSAHDQSMNFTYRCCLYPLLWCAQWSRPSDDLLVSSTRSHSWCDVLLWKTEDPDVASDGEAGPAAPFDGRTKPWQLRTGTHVPTAVASCCGFNDQSCLTSANHVLLSVATRACCVCHRLTPLLPPLSHDNRL
jgi:hypothetical protein